MSEPDIDALIAEARRRSVLVVRVADADGWATNDETRLLASNAMRLADTLDAAQQRIAELERARDAHFHRVIFLESEYDIALRDEAKMKAERDAAAADNAALLAEHDAALAVVAAARDILRDYRCECGAANHECGSLGPLSIALDAFDSAVRP